MAIWFIDTNLNLVQLGLTKIAPVELWSGIESVNDTSIALSEAVSNFHFVMVVGQFSSFANQAMAPLVLPTSLIDYGASNNVQALSPYSSTLTAMLFRFQDSTHLYTISGFSASQRLRKVYGLLRK